MADPAAALRHLLEEERQLLLSGDFAPLARLAEAKEKALASASDFDSATLARLGPLLHRNQSLLAASLAGIRDTTSRIRTMREIARGLSTYGRDGKLARDVTEGPKVSKRT
jgi:flagellar biosynthesis/type III secretory pathway chaperone